MSGCIYGTFCKHSNLSEQMNDCKTLTTKHIKRRGGKVSGKISLIVIRGVAIAASISEASTQNAHSTDWDNNCSSRYLQPGHVLL